LGSIELTIHSHDRHLPQQEMPTGKTGKLMTDFEETEAVRVWREQVTIPTYETGKPDPNPFFLEKRVYQGSSGVVYPFPVVESVSDVKSDRVYDAVFLENEYLKIMILPELGGRVQMALDKTNDYHFVYYNRVIKPALVGLAGPWISGGIEFNWPQHHRPSTFHPVDVEIVANDDQSHTVWCNEIDRMAGTRGMHGFTLYPDRAYLEIRVRLFNRTPLPQTFLWWANPAVHVDDNHQSIFPPDVCAVMDHGKRDVSSFPIAKGEYYKVNYAPGTDISRYKNIPVPTSYMAYRSDYNFVGSYDHGRQAGLLHVASHHISPGKKQWTWGCGEFGKAWDRHLTDEDGPYVELMCGVYTDNQPDFSWIAPGEEKSFSQYFMPYKGVGVIKNATVDAVLGLEVVDSRAITRVYTTAQQHFARIVVQLGNVTLIDGIFDSSPQECREFTAHLPMGTDHSNLKVHVFDQSGRELVSYVPKRIDPRIPEPAREIPEPTEIDSSESLFLAGTHLEQYRHATRAAEDYYREALLRDPGDLRCNLAYGRVLYRRGNFREAEQYFRSAAERAIRHNPNPADGECFYLLGLAQMAQEKFTDAELNLHKATWNAACQDAAWFLLARIAFHNKRWSEAEELLHKCLSRNSRHQQATHLLTVSLLEQQKLAEAHALVEQELAIDPFNYGILFEAAHALDYDWKTCDQRLRDSSFNYLELALDYAAAGRFDRASAVLEHYMQRVGDQSDDPLVFYYLAEFQEKLGDSDTALSLSYQAASQVRNGFFPNRLQDIAVLKSAIDRYPGDYRALCDLGNILYSRRRYGEAIRCWEDSRSLAADFAQPSRNLGLAYFNHRHDPEAAWKCLRDAQRINPDDARILFELDQLAKRLNHDPESRLTRLQLYPRCVSARDDLTIEQISLLNQLGRQEEVLDLLLQRQFHPWEGGEGKASAQYVLSLTELARRALADGNHAQAFKYLNRALNWPESLGEGKLYGIQENNIHYWLGVACQLAREHRQATKWFDKASQGLAEPHSPQFYNDQPPEMIFYQGLALRALGRESEANQRFSKLVEYGQKHLNDTVTVDFFAVSLPDFLVFEADLMLKNELHCRYMLSLGYLGLQKDTAAEEQFERILELDANHIGAITHRQFDSSLISTAG
jgi:tetratricopeptide (TPR) repeat protein